MTTTPPAEYSLPRPALFVQDKVFIPGTSDVAIGITLAWNDPVVDPDPMIHTTAAKVYVGDKTMVQYGMARAIAAAIESILPAYCRWVEDQLNNEEEDDAEADAEADTVGLDTSLDRVDPLAGTDEAAPGTMPVLREQG